MFNVCKFPHGGRARLVDGRCGVECAPNVSVLRKLRLCIMVFVCIGSGMRRLPGAVSALLQTVRRRVVLLVSTLFLSWRSGHRACRSLLTK